MSNIENVAMYILFAWVYHEDSWYSSLQHVVFNGEARQNVSMENVEMES